MVPFSGPLWFLFLFSWNAVLFHLGRLTLPFHSCLCSSVIATQDLPAFSIWNNLPTPPAPGNFRCLAVPSGDQETHGYRALDMRLCCLVTKSCPTLCDSMDGSTPGFPILYHLLEFAQTQVHWVSGTIQPSHPLSSPSPPAFNLSWHQVLFEWVGSLQQVAKTRELQFLVLPNF